MSYGGAPYGSTPYGVMSSGEMYQHNLADTMAASLEHDYFLALHAALTESAASALALTGVSDPSITEAIVLVEGFIAYNQAMNSLTETQPITDGVLIVLLAIASASTTTSDATTAVLDRLTEIVDTLILTGAATSQVAALEAVVEALLIEYFASPGWGAAATSATTASDAITAQAALIAAAVSSAAAALSLAPTFTATALVDETLNTADALGTSMAFFNALADDMSMRLSLTFGNESFTAYALSLHTRAADGSLVAGVVEYQNFPFNSFAYFNGKYWGASEDGIFELTGSDDNGDEIAAYVRSALNTVGTNRLKRMPSIYLGYTSDSTLVLKVVTVVNGAKVEDWYTLRESPADVMRDGRIKIGKGLKSVYWAWELHNKDGGDFALDIVELMPLALDRRINNGN